MLCVRVFAGVNRLACFSFELRLLVACIVAVVYVRLEVALAVVHPAHFEGERSMSEAVNSLQPANICCQPTPASQQRSHKQH